MPTRLLREGILESERVNELDWPAEVFYRRLMSKVDDYGLYTANCAVLRAHLYPLRVDRVREADISRWIAACVKAGLIVLYEADGKPYLRMLDTNWQTRSKPKHPLPNDNNCKHMITVGHLDEDVFEDEDEDGGDINNSALRPVHEVFDYWCRVMGKERAKLSGKRKAKITTRLKSYTVEEIKSAIDGCARSDFHMGKNDNGTAYNDIELICRSDEKIEFFQNVGSAKPSGPDYSSFLAEGAVHESH